MIELVLDGRRVHVLPLIKGLISEAERLEKAFHSLSPSRVLIPLPPEQLPALGSPESFSDYTPSAVELAYAHHLSHFGEVEIPAPCWVRAYSLCQEHEVEILPLDMPEDVFSDIYLDRVGALELLRETRFAKKALKRRFDKTSPEAFVLDWDAKLNSSRGFRAVERAREEFIANSARNLAIDGSLLLLEWERLEPILEILRTPHRDEP